MLRVAMAKMSLLTVVLAGLLAGSGLAHPGESHSVAQLKAKIASRDIGINHANSLVSSCSGTVQHQQLLARAAERRSLNAQLLREKRGLVEQPMISKRDQAALDKWLNTCHDHSSTSNFDASTPEATIFTSNATTALTPETIIGPYFVAGEYLRSDIAEDQAGIPIQLELQFVDVATCKPVPNLLVDIWHANATGFYSGVAMPGQGGLNSTFLRGVQNTDAEGVVSFASIFPGHYMGRTNHIHVVSRRGGKLLKNGTYEGGTVNHIGQLYFDQELVGAVEAMDPYDRNSVVLTTNRQDFLTGDQATAAYDPFVDYVMLSNDANDGLLMWITVGVNTSADYTANAGAAAHYYQGGGVASEGQGQGGPPFPWPANATGWPSGVPFPTGTFPGFPSGFPSGFPTGFPGPGGGFPGFPTSTAAASATPRPWGPCIGKREVAEVRDEKMAEGK